MINRAMIALGSNIGDRESFLLEAVNAISKIAQTKLLVVSNIYETEPVGFLEQGPFLNMCICIETQQEPLLLLASLQKIENDLKRIRDKQWGPRTIDIDILRYNDIVMGLPVLTIPHPRMLERAFVLIPLKDVYIGEKIDTKEIEDRISRCEDKEGVQLYKRVVLKSGELIVMG